MMVTLAKENPMIKVARGYLYFMVAFQAAVGITALFAPEIIAAKFDLLPQSIKGTAEIRGLYGGGVLSWSLITLGALRCKPLSPGLLIALMTLMGSIAAGRVVSLIVDHETALNIPAGIAEALMALASWLIYKHYKR